MRTFGKNLERLEQIKGRFETDICRHNKIPCSTYRQWKEGSQEIFLQRLIRLADYFHTSVDALLRENLVPTPRHGLTRKELQNILTELFKACSS